MKRFRGAAIPTVLCFFLVAIIFGGWGRAVESVVARMDVPLDDYRFAVSFNPENRFLAGSMYVTWTNRTPLSHTTLPFRVYPNASHYIDGALNVESAHAGGEPAATRLLEDPTILEVELGVAVTPGESIRLQLDFTTTIPTDPTASFGILAGDSTSGWRLADWYPVIAGWEDDGWYLAPPTELGDPTFPASATWSLDLEAPDRYVVIASGHETARETRGGGVTVTRITAGPGRDLTLTLLPMETADRIEAVADNLAITVYDGMPSTMEAMALEIADAVSVGYPALASWFGCKLVDELDVVLTPLAGASAVSWYGMIWIDPDRFLSEGVLTAAGRERLRFTVFHELAHQWIPGIVGSNNNTHGYMSEGLASTLALLAARDVYGVTVAHGWLRDFAATPYRSLVATGADGVVDTPVTNETNATVRIALVYGKAALGFEAIRQEIGDAAFRIGLREYVALYRYANSRPEDLRAAWESVACRDLRELWSQWFDEATTTPDDVDDILAGFARGVSDSNADDQTVLGSIDIRIQTYIHT